jgi:glutaredoxin
MATPPVTLYTISTCLHCRDLRKMLDRHNIAYDFTDVDLMEPEDLDAFLTNMKEYNEKKTFPIVIIGNKAIIGFQAQVIKKELGIDQDG